MLCNDFSIGVGCVVKILQQILLLEGGSSLLYGCLSSATYSPGSIFTGLNNVFYKTLLNELLLIIEKRTTKPEQLFLIF